MYTKRKVFSGSYYKLFIFTSFLNIACYINSWPTLRMPNIVCKNCTFSEFFEAKDFVGLTAMRFLYYSFALMPSFIEVIFALNRYHALAHNFSYQDTWRKLQYPTMVAIILFPIPFAYPALTNPSYSKYHPLADHYYYTSDESKGRRSITLAGLEGLSSITVLVTGIATLRALLKNSPIKNRSREVKLFAHAMVNFLLLLCISAYGILYTFFANRVWLIVNSFAIQAYLMDLACFGSVYAMLLCNSELRNYVLLMIGLKKPKQPEISVSITTRQQDRRRST